MIIIPHKIYFKSFSALSEKNQNKVIERIVIFKNNPYHPLLNNHKLKGNLRGFRPISVTGDLRIIIKEINNYEIVEFLDIGTHSKLYG